MSSKNKEENNKKQKYYIILGIIVLCILLAILTVFMVNEKTKEKDNEIAYTELIKEINDGNIEKIEMTVGSTTIKVKLKSVEEEKKSIVPSTQPFVELIQDKVENGNNIELIQKQPNAFITIGKTLFSLLPTIMLVILFVLIFKMQGLGEKEKYMMQTLKIQK